MGHSRIHGASRDPWGIAHCRSRIHGALLGPPPWASSMRLSMGHSRIHGASRDPWGIAHCHWTCCGCKALSLQPILPAKHAVCQLLPCAFPDVCESVCVYAGTVQHHGRAEAGRAHQ
eukprot:1158078-Pelagomonas_calceolata.AAC.7